MIDFLSLIQIHGYWLLFLITIFEGAAIVYIGAFAASIGILNIYAVLFICILGNITSDLILFGIGRIARKTIINRIMKHFKISEKKIHTLKTSLKKHFGKTLLMIKAVPPLPVPGLIMAGASGVSWKKFAFYSLLITAIYTSIFTLLGFYSGVAFNTILGYIRYGNWLVSVLITSVVMIWYIIIRLMRIVARKVEEI